MLYFHNNENGYHYHYRAQLQTALITQKME